MRKLAPCQIPTGRISSLALIANLGVAVAGLALTGYLASAAQ